MVGYTITVVAGAIYTALNLQERGQLQLPKLPQLPPRWLRVWELVQAAALRAMRALPDALRPSNSAGGTGTEVATPASAGGAYAPIGRV